MRMSLKSLLFAVLALPVVSLVSGCGTIGNFSTVGKERISIQTNVDSPRISVNGDLSKYYEDGTILVDKSSETIFIKIEKDGYKPENISLTRNLRGGLVFADSIPLFIPLLIDAASSEIYEVSPKSISVFLVEKENKGNLK